jgi:serine/threonine-protein kinase
MLQEGEFSHRWPQFLPDGKTVLFTVGLGAATAAGNFDDSHIALASLDNPEHHVLVRGGTYARYVPTGHLVYYRAGTVMAVPFDLARLEVTGTAAPVLEGVMSSTSGFGAGQFTFSNNGSLAYVPGGATTTIERTLVWVDRKGTEQALPAPAQTYDHPQLSPDGRQLALTIAAQKNDIWIYDLSRGTLTRLTFEGSNQRPLWTPDGTSIIFRSARGKFNVFRKSADGTSAEEQLTQRERIGSPSSISPDGKFAFYTDGGSTGRDIWIISLDDDPKASISLQTPFNEVAPKISPEGRWLAYVSDESGRNEVYVRPFPASSGKWQISTDGGGEPQWARNGRELFYRAGDKLMAVSIEAGTSFQAGTPQLLFERSYVKRPSGPGEAETNFDVSPDGQRFLMVKAKEEAQQSLSQIHVVLNWFEDLKRRVPTGR